MSTAAVVRTRYASITIFDSAGLSQAIFCDKISHRISGGRFSWTISVEADA